MRLEGTYGLQSLSSNEALRVFDGSITEALYTFPNGEHIVLDELQKKWRSGEWNTSLYELLYQFHRFGCTNPRDRVYAFLGLAIDRHELDIVLTMFFPHIWSTWIQQGL